MKNLYYFLLAFSSLLFIACNNHAPKSFEICPMGDTINLVDANGMKQGLWLMPISKDTMIWLNDTGHSADRTTSAEIIRFLKQNGNKAVVPIEKVDGHYVAPNLDSVKVGS
jgi:hypothetical protein